jgi:hypothetical protein
MTLASMSMAAPATPATPVLASATDAEGQALTGSDKVADTNAGSKAGVDAEESARVKDRERKRKERGATAAAKSIQGEISTSVSTLMTARSSPHKSPEKSLRPAPVPVLNWSPSDDVRMVLVTCSPQMQQLFGMLGHDSNRGELQGSNSSTDARPTTAFFEQLAEIFSDVSFQGAVPDDWGRDDHLPQNKLYAPRQSRVTSFMKDK